MAKTTRYGYMIRERWMDAVLHAMQLNDESMSDVCNRIGAPPTQVYRLYSYYTGKRVGNEAPTLDMIVELCKAYDYSVAWVMTGDGEMKISESEREELRRLRKQVSDLKGLILV